MKKIVLIILINSLFIQLCFPQEGKHMNKGRVKHNNYYSTIPYEIIGGKIIIPVKINGESKKFMLDTGSPLIISKSVYDETLCGEIIDFFPIINERGNNDTINIIALCKIELGDIIFYDTPAIIDNEILNISNPHQIDGIIGSNLLRNSIVQIDPVNLNITITDNSRKLKLNKVKQYSSNMWLSPFKSDPYVWVKINNKINEQFLFDSGKSTLIDLSLNHMEQLQKYDAFNNTGNELYLKKIKFKQAKLKNIKTGKTTEDVSSIGNNILKYGTITLDYKNKKFYFQPLTISDKNLIANNKK